MPSNVNFIGAGFSLESVSQTALATLRVRFTQDPIAANPANANDATNPANYTLVGPGVYSITNVVAVYGDPQAVDIFLAQPLAAGVWTLVASTNIHETDTSALTAPTSLAFTVSALVMPEAVSQGAQTDAEADILRKHLNPALKGSAWDALIAAIATGEQKNRDNARTAFDQLFKTSASGIYLDRKAADDGVQKPINIGMPDALYRQYAISVTNDKLVEGALLKVMEVFYGADAVRAHQDSTVAQPYVLHDGDDLIVTLDENTTISVTFTAADFAIIGQATAAEVAAALTRAFQFAGSDAFALANVDAQTGTTKVRIYSPSRGLGSSVRIAGGKAQTTLQFPTLLPATGLPTWNITFTPATNNLRFSPTSQFDCSQVRVGDYVAVYGTEFNAGNRGTFVITNVSWSYTGGVTLVQYFDVTNSLGSSQAGLAQVAAADLMVFRPTRATIHDTPSRAVIVSSIGPEVDITLPATSQAVGRGANEAAYLPVATAQAITAATRNPSGVLYLTVPGHGLSTGAQIIVDGLVGSNTAPPVTAGVGNVADSCPVSHISPGQGAVWGSIVDVTADGTIVIAGNDQSTSSQKLQITSIVTDPVTGAKAVTNVATNTGALTGSHFFRSAHSAGISGNWTNAIVATGGWDSIGLGINNLAAYYSNNAWTALPTMAFARASHAQVTLNDGRILVMGGYNGGPLNTVERLTATGAAAWSTVAAMATNRFKHQAIVLKNGKVLVVGGLLSGANPSDTSGTPTNLCEIYDPTGNTWSATGQMSFTRWGHLLFMLPDGRVMCAGGSGYNITQQPFTVAPLTAVEIYDPNTGRWDTAGNTLYAHDSAWGGYLAPTNEVILGGGTVSAVIERYDVAAGKWSASLATAPGMFSTNSIAVPLTNGLLILATPFGNWIYIPNANTMYAIGANGVFNATKVDANTLSVQTNTASWCSYSVTGATITPMAAPTVTYNGPFIYDPHSGLAITASHSTTSTQLAQGQKYGYIDVVDATQFPDAPGWLVFNFGYATQCAPVAYFGRISNTRLALDGSFKFPSTVAAGSDVALLYTKAPWVPSAPQSVGSFYLTASPAGRVAAVDAINASTAAGVNVDVIITYPGDRGLGGEGQPTHGVSRLTGAVEVFAGDDVDGEVANARVS